MGYGSCGRFWKRTFLQLPGSPSKLFTAWSFPNSLMVAFKADYAGGEITIPTLKAFANSDDGETGHPP
jgi:hypothetical protein